MTLTYVVIGTWDDGRNIYPLSYWKITWFEHWARSIDETNGSLRLDMDRAAPFDELRKELYRLLEHSPPGGDRCPSLKVVWVTEGNARIQIRTSAAGSNNSVASRASSLETMLRYLVQPADEGMQRAGHELVTPQTPEPA